MTLVGPVDGRFTVLVGDPSLASGLLGTSSSPSDLSEVYDGIAADLTAAGFDVRRNPLVRRATPGQVLPHAELAVRDWHHITWNNRLVENSAEAGRHVYLPTFGHGDDFDLKVVDEHMARLWEDLGFSVHLLADFGSFARRQGVVHCIKKYLRRGA